MVETEGKRDEVARVSLVSTKGVLLDEFVLPEGKITDYRTQYSGITAENLAACTNSFSLFVFLNESLSVDSTTRVHRNDKNPLDFGRSFVRKRFSSVKIGA